MVKYYLSYHLVEGEEANAIKFCDEINSGLTKYMRANHPAHYTPYYIKDNYGPGKDWDGWICWYYTK